MDTAFLKFFFLNNEQLYHTCINKPLSYYKEKILEHINREKGAYNRQELKYIIYLINTLDRHFNQNVNFDKMDLYQFFTMIFSMEWFQYVGQLKERLTQLSLYFDYPKPSSKSHFNAYRQTAAYPGPDQDYCQSNLVIHNQILDITTDEFVLPNPLEAEELTQTAFGNTALLLAAKTGHTKASLMLVDQHTNFCVDVNYPDPKGMTPLHWACFYRDNDLIDALLKAGARLDLRNSDGDSPLDLYTMHLSNGSQFQGNRPFGAGFPHIPAISDGSLTALTIGDGQHKKSLVDLAFHMDKVSFHKNGTSLQQLDQEVIHFLKMAPGLLQMQTNKIFEVFTFYHFHRFISMRNQVLIDPALSARLDSNNKNLVQTQAPMRQPYLMGRTHLAIQRNALIQKINGMNGVMLGHEFIPMVNRKTRDFNQKLCSVGSSNSREVILLDPKDQVLKQIYNQFKTNLSNQADPQVILNEVRKLTKTCFPGKKPEGFIEESLKNGNQIISLSEFILKKQGVCRHHTLLNAYLLSRLVADGLLLGNVIHHRQDFFNGAHTWNVFQAQNGKIYSLDSLWDDVTCISDNPGLINGLYGQDVETQINNMHFAQPPQEKFNPKKPENPLIIKDLVILQKEAIKYPSQDYAKKIVQIKNYIESTHFIVGDYLLWKGGLTLKLEGGGEKRVPHSVYKIYENIMQHRADLSEPAQAKKLWQSIQLLAKTALSQSKSDRHHTTTSFYENIVANSGAFTEVASDFENKSKLSK